MGGNSHYLHDSKFGYPQTKFSPNKVYFFCFYKNEKKLKRRETIKLGKIGGHF